MRLSLDWARVVAIEEHQEYTAVHLEGGHTMSVFEPYEAVISRWREAMSVSRTVSRAASILPVTSAKSAGSSTP